MTTKQYCKIPGYSSRPRSGIPAILKKGVFVISGEDICAFPSKAKLCEHPSQAWNSLLRVPGLRLELELIAPTHFT